MPDRVLRYVWTSDGAAARLARIALVPAGWAFAAAVALRNRAYDQGRLPSHALALPTICVGNLSVGGTGKTPVAAWIAQRLRDRGTTPAIVLRGFGDDEPLVHQRLNPGMVVIADADRVRAVASAREAGATVAVLDDGFQHRRARRDADVVLLSADDTGPMRPLPAGPWREPLPSLVRASVVVVTRKHAAPSDARALLSRALQYAPRAFGVVIELAADQLVNVATGERVPVSALSGHDVLAISAIGNPRAFELQVCALGARVSSASYPDHHHFTAADVAVLVRRVPPAAWAICTLKDAVKLTDVWPRAATPLWYLSQRVSVEAGGDMLDGFLAQFALLAAPQGSTTPAAAGPKSDTNVS